MAVALLAPFAAVEAGHPGDALATHCVGDCNADGDVTVDELVTSVRIVLGEMPLERCNRLDADPADGEVGIGDLSRAVLQSLQGCLCGNGIVDQIGEECDGDSDRRCPGNCLANCRCEQFCVQAPREPVCSRCRLPGGGCGFSRYGIWPCCGNATCVIPGLPVPIPELEVDVFAGECESLECDTGADCSLASGCENGLCCGTAGEECIGSGNISVQHIPTACCGELECIDGTCLQQ